MVDSPSRDVKGPARQVNNSLYELYKPPGTPRLQILFFHGLQPEYSSAHVSTSLSEDKPEYSSAHVSTLLSEDKPEYSSAHVSTWLSEDNSCVWPKSWLVEEFPHAHILTISYTTAIQKSYHEIMMDFYHERRMDSVAEELRSYYKRTMDESKMDSVAEELLSDLMNYDIGQIAFCPVILVGHSFGVLVIKEICYRAHFLSETRNYKLWTFLDNIRGIFFYGAPQDSSFFRLTNVIKDPMLLFFETLYTSVPRLSHEFNNICKLHENWKLAGLGATLPTTILSGEYGFTHSTASAYDGEGDFNLVEGVDHFSISKPRGKTAMNFYKLKEFITGIIPIHDLEEPQLQGLPRYPVDLKRRARQVQDMLREAEVVGIVGMSGIGKTTIAKQVFNSICRDFEYSCFVENLEFQQLLINFYQHGRKIDSPEISWLERKKTLIVMDNVGSENQLKALPRIDFFGPGSRLIITSDSEEVLTFFENCNLYKVDCLDINASKKLLCQCAGLEESLGNSPGIHRKRYVEVVVNKCGGLPLTLEVIGSCLWGHVDDANYWKQTIDKLRKAESISGVNERVWDPLRVSYANLAPSEQQMFIDAAIYFYGRRLDLALEAWDGAYKNAHTMWANLVSRSMVKVTHRQTSGRTHNIVWVHQHLRDLAASLAKGYMVDDFNADADTSMNAREVDQNTQILRLLNTPSKQHAINFDVVVKLRKLKYLELFGAIEGDSLKKFPKNLSLLWWRVPDESTSIFRQIQHNELRNLAVLELENWKVSKEFPEALGSLTNLRILSLRSLRVLKHLPENFGGLAQLKQLTLSNLDLQSLPANFGNLVALEEVTLELDRLKFLPDSICQLRVLRRLEIHALYLEALPDRLGTLESLQVLDVKCPTLTTLPSSIGKLSQLQYLHLDVHRVKALPKSVGQLSVLRFMELTSAVPCLPDSIAQLSSLQTLRLLCRNLNSLSGFVGQSSCIQNLEINCDILLELPKSLGDLASLNRLKIQARSLVEIPESIGQLSCLTDFTVESERLRILPNSFGQLSSLQTLDLICPNLEYLPESLWCLASLNTLKLKVDKLASISERFGQLSSLVALTIQSASLKNLPSSLGELSTLQTLDLACDNLEFLPDAFRDLLSLKRLALKARSLVSIPESTRQLCSLVDLTLESENLRYLPASFGQLRQLRNLHLTCDNLEGLPDTFGELSTLQTLDLACDNLKFLPHGFGKLLSLERLALKARSLVRIPESTRQLFSLVDLTLESENLRYLPASFGQLCQLRNLHLTCDNLEFLPDSFGELSTLQTLDLACDKLEFLPDGFVKLLSLKRLALKARSLVRIPESTGQLSSLVDLTLESENLRYLPASFGQLSALRDLHLTCGNLEDLPDSFGDLSSLKKLSLKSRSLVSIPRSMEQLFSRRDLIIEPESLRNLLRSLGKLSTSGQLELHFDSLETLQDNLGNASPLERLDISAESLVSMPERTDQLSSVEHMDNPEFNVLWLFIRLIKERDEDGYFVSSEWFFRLQENGRESLMYALGEAGYSEACQTSTTTLFARIGNDGKSGITSNEASKPSSSTEKNCDDLLGIARETWRTYKNADSTGVSSSNDKGESSSSTENARRAATWKSINTAVKSKSHENICVGTQWLTNLRKYEKDALVQNLWEAGYVKMSQTSNTTLYKRIQDQVRNLAADANDESSTSSSRNHAAGVNVRRRGISKLFKWWGSSKGDVHDKDDSSSSSSMPKTMETRRIQDDKSTCHPQLLTVVCSSSSGASSVLAPDGDLSEDFSRHQFDDLIGQQDFISIDIYSK